MAISALAGALQQFAAPSVASGIAAFRSTLGGKSPRTEATYSSSLRRFCEFLEEEGLPPGDLPTDALPATILERYHAWLVQSYGRERRATVQTYLAAARALMAFLDRRGWLATDVSSERMRGHLREVMGKANYKTPRIDRGLALVVVKAEALSTIPDGRPNDPATHLELLRDRAILHTLFATAIRREEASRLNREDLDDGWSR